MRALYLLKPKKVKPRSNWYSWLKLDMFRRRINRGKNVIIFVDGDTGSGKSSASLFISFDNDPMWRASPSTAIRMFTVFSARELNIMIAMLVNAGFLKSDESIFRGRFLVAEEAESNSIVQAGAVQDLIENVQVFRKYVINVVFNMPFSDDLAELKRKVVHYVIWLRDFDGTALQAYGELLARYRYRKIVEFMHPRYRNMLLGGVYPPYFAGIFANRPGARIVIPFAPRDLWLEYEKQKDLWFATKSIIVLKRMRRLAKVRGDLGAYVARPHLISIEKKIVDNLGDTIYEQLLERAEKQRALTGNESIVDIVQDILYMSEKDIQKLDIDDTTKEILRLRLLKGLRIRKIAEKVGLAHPTVHQRILKFARKLGIVDFETKTNK